MKQKKPANATVVNFGVSFLHLKETEKTEKPIEEVNPKIKPTIEVVAVLPIAIITIPIVAKIIEIQTFKDIFSLKNKNPNKAVKNEKVAIPVVLIAGIIWSFGPLVVRYMDDPHLVPWQYIFGRGLTIFIVLNLYLFFEEGKNFYKNYFKIGYSGVIGGTGLGIE